LHDLKALKSETVNWLNWNNFGLSVHKQSLNFDPLLLLFCKIVGALSFLDFIIELINNNRNEQIHDEESGKEDVNDVQY
jgi:hypothetical protein